MAVGQKKRKSDPSKWQRTQAKTARVKGVELKNSNGDLIVRERVMGEMNCRCECSKLLTDDEKEFIFETFSYKSSHEQQNEYLRGCTEVKGVELLRNGTERRLFVYKLHFNNKTIEVCKLFFLAIHGIKEGRLKRKVQNREVDIKDGRGKHANHKRVTSDETKDSMRIFFMSLPARPSHYSRNNNPSRKYMESNWNVAKLYEMFFQYFPEIQRHEATQVIFREIFNTEFNIKFGYPRSDICETCSSLLASIKSMKTDTPDNEEGIDDAYNALNLHHNNADIFYKDLAFAKEYPENHVAICMDFQQNIPIPVTKIGKEFYLRQLWVHNFGIKDLKSRETTLFMYSEHFAKKGSNEVLSCLLWYVENVVPLHVRFLTLFCDNPSGQNKNRMVFSALQDLANQRFERVYIKFPVPGHSRMPVDSDFGLIEKVQRKTQHIFEPSDVTGFVMEARKKDPFNIVYVNNPLTNDLCDDRRPVVIVRNYKESLEDLFCTQNAGGMNLNAIREIMFARDALPIINVSDRFGNPPRSLNMFDHNVTPDDLNTKIRLAPPAYDDYIPINLAKVSNLRTLIPHTVTESKGTFYATVYAFGTDGLRVYIDP